MHPDPKVHLDRKIQELSAELEALKGLRAALENEAAAAELNRLFGNGSTKVSRKPTAKGKRKPATNYEKVVKFFKDRNNEWTGVPDLATGANIARGVASNVLYSGTHRDSFEWKANDNPESNVQKLVRLKAGHD